MWASGLPMPRWVQPCGPRVAQVLSLVAVARSRWSWQYATVDTDERRAFIEAMIASSRTGYRTFPTMPSAICRVPMEWGFGPACGWGLRRKVRRVRTALESQGFVVTTCVVGRRYRLVRDRLVSWQKQDRLGMAAVLVAERPATEGGDPAGDREPRFSPHGSPSGTRRVERSQGLGP